MKPCRSSSLGGRLIGLLLVPMLLVACGGGEPEDVRAWMRESAKDLKARIPALPQIKPLEVLAFEPGDVVSPFAPEKALGDSGAAVSGPKAPGAKNINPDAYPLVRVPTEAIRLIGTMVIGKELVALVAAERDFPRRVRVGDYIGQNGGRVMAIRPATDRSEAEVLIRESVLEKGLWVERENRLTAPSQGDSK